jgi:hypothetical protein
MGPVLDLGLKITIHVIKSQIHLVRQSLKYNTKLRSFLRPVMGGRMLIFFLIVRQRDSALRKVKQLERQLEEQAQARRLEGGDQEGDPDNDRRARLGRLEGENVLLR